MPAPATLHDLLQELHEQGAINLDTPLGKLVAPDTLDGVAPQTGAARLPSDIFVGPRYVYVTLTPGNVEVAGVADVAAEVRDATGQNAERASTSDRIPPAGSFATLNESGLVNLAAPLRSLVSPGSGGAVLLRDEGPAVFIHQNYVIVHIPDPAPQIADVSTVADEVTRLTGA